MKRSVGARRGRAGRAEAAAVAPGARLGPGGVGARSAQGRELPAAQTRVGWRTARAAEGSGGVGETRLPLVSSPEEGAPEEGCVSPEGSVASVSQRCAGLVGDGY